MVSKASRLAVAALAVLASTSATCSSLADDRERETTCAEAPRAFIRQAWALSGSVDDVGLTATRFTSPAMARLVSGQARWRWCRMRPAAECRPFRH